MFLSLNDQPRHQKFYVTRAVPTKIKAHVVIFAQIQVLLSLRDGKMVLGMSLI